MSGAATGVVDEDEEVREIALLLDCEDESLLQTEALFNSPSFPSTLAGSVNTSGIWAGNHSSRRRANA